MAGVRELGAPLRSWGERFEDDRSLDGPPHRLQGVAAILVLLLQGGTSLWRGEGFMSNLVSHLFVSRLPATLWSPSRPDLRSDAGGSSASACRRKPVEKALPDLGRTLLLSHNCVGCH